MNENEFQEELFDTLQVMQDSSDRTNELLGYILEELKKLNDSKRRL